MNMDDKIFFNSSFETETLSAHFNRNKFLTSKQQTNSKSKTDSTSSLESVDLNLSSESLSQNQISPASNCHSTTNSPSYKIHESFCEPDEQFYTFHNRTTNPFLNPYLILKSHNESDCSDEETAKNKSSKNNNLEENECLSTLPIVPVSVAQSHFSPFKRISLPANLSHSRLKQLNKTKIENNSNSKKIINEDNSNQSSTSFSDSPPLFRIQEANQRNCKSFDDSPGNQSLIDHRNSVFDDLLFEIYSRWHYSCKDSVDSDTFTDLTESDVVVGSSSCRHDNEELQQQPPKYGNGDATTKVRLNEANLMKRNLNQLEELVGELRQCTNQLNQRLVRQLKTREKQMNSLKEKFDIMTAILHASSLKRREDSKIKFSIEPMPGRDAFVFWKDAMRSVARLPGGIPDQFRKKVWLSLADNHLTQLRIDWDKTKKFTFNEKSNPDDNKLGLQIVKDLHRTGFSGFSGHDNEEDRAVLKRVLLAYARWNKKVGYCQGFNILAAFILRVVDGQEDSALKLMIYIVDKVLPDSYFSENLRSLLIDIAVFRDIMRIHLPKLSRHLDFLQVESSEGEPNNYEPPLTNVFMMQWLLTMYATCLHSNQVLRIWDCVLLNGSELLLTTAVVIWEKLQSRLLNVSSANEFYSKMAVLSEEMSLEKFIDAEHLIKKSFLVGNSACLQINELREKFTFNITPFINRSSSTNTSALSKASHSSSSSLSTNSHLHNMEASGGERLSMSSSSLQKASEGESIDSINCFSAIFAIQNNNFNKFKDETDNSDFSKLTPGAYTAHPDFNLSSFNSTVLSERASLDLEKLKKQYKRVMLKQKQAHLVLSISKNKKITNDQLKEQINKTNNINNTTNNNCNYGNNNHVAADNLVYNLLPPTINHLFASRDLVRLSDKNQTILPVRNNILETKLGFDKKTSLYKIDEKIKKKSSYKNKNNDNNNNNNKLNSNDINLNYKKNQNKIVSNLVSNKSKNINNENSIKNNNNNNNNNDNNNNNNNNNNIHNNNLDDNNINESLNIKKSDLTKPSTFLNEITNSIKSNTTKTTTNSTTTSTTVTTTTSSYSYASTAFVVSTSTCFSTSCTSVGISNTSASVDKNNYSEDCNRNENSNKFKIKPDYNIINSQLHAIHIYTKSIKNKNNYDENNKNNNNDDDKNNNDEDKTKELLEFNPFPVSNSLLLKMRKTNKVSQQLGLYSHNQTDPKDKRKSSLNIKKDLISFNDKILPHSNIKAYEAVKNNNNNKINDENNINKKNNINNNKHNNSSNEYQKWKARHNACLQRQYNIAASNEIMHK